MSARVAAWLAWSLWTVTMAGYAFMLLLAFLKPSLVGDDPVVIFVPFTSFVLAFATVGALVASRRPGNPVGWILCASALAYAVGGFTGNYAHYTFNIEPGALPAGALVAWVSNWVWTVGAGLPGTYLLLLFPNGRLPSRRWRPIAWLAAGGMVLMVASIAFAPGPFDDLPIDNPLGVPGGGRILGVVGGIGGFLLIFSVIASIASLFFRFRRVTGGERQQLKWLTYAAALVALCVVSSTSIEVVAGPSERVTDLSNMIITGSLTAIPVAVGIAILRYRLYDIDLIVNRTLVYGALTVALGLVYFGSVVLLQQGFRVLTGQESNLAIVASTLAIAALFQPLRRRMQTFIDRRFYRRKYDAARTLAAFSARLRDETDLNALTDDLVGVVRETVQPAHVSLWLRAPEE